MDITVGVAGVVEEDVGVVEAEAVIPGTMVAKDIVTHLVGILMVTTAVK